MYYPLEVTCAFYGNACSWKTTAKPTQFGWTAKVLPGLEIHLGHSMYLRRGGPEKAFCFDTDDYRYEILLNSLGLPTLRRSYGFLLGCVQGYEDGIIHFRVCPPDDATELIVCIPEWTSKSGSSLKEWANTEPMYSYYYEKDSVALMVYVFSLARPNFEANGTEPELNDGYYDDDPDIEDCTGSHYDPNLSEADNIETRLLFAGFIV